MTKWEYKVEFLTPTELPESAVSMSALEDTLNQYGDEGWELVSLLSPALTVFKRHLEG